ncbi:MAG: NarK/NasA family nitrate transporter [Bacteroidetes bacterium]|nr:NarK/NasA family nitrate transporter [Bacteroidota bacterium]
MTENRSAILVLALNTFAFTVCFAVWTMNGVLVTFLVEQGVFAWDKGQIGWLIGIPVLTGSVMRLPIGVLTDRFGGRLVFGLLLLCSAIPTFFLSYATSFTGFLLASLGFGLSGASFAVGIAYTSLWFRKDRQGTALGIFGVGNAGAALTSLGAPVLLQTLTGGGQHLEAWRALPRIYAVALVVTALVFFAFAKSRKVEHGQELTLLRRLAPLRYLRVWRFGFYYFVVFGGFVALAQWLIPYYVNAYGMTVAFAGFMASLFSFPTGVIRAAGGWLSDRFGARAVMTWVFGLCLVCFALLCVPRMDIESPGQGIMAEQGGVVTEVTSEKISVSGRDYQVLTRPGADDRTWDNATLIWPTFTFWQEPAVRVGDSVVKKQLLARGVTHVYFQANVWVFSILVFLVGIMMGVGMAGVYKLIPEYYPKEVGIVGGIVGVIGGLGGFTCPIIFGYLLQTSGIWTTAWMFLFIVTLGSYLWLHVTVRKILREQAPLLDRQIEDRRQVQGAVEGVPIQIQRRHAANIG